MRETECARLDRLLKEVRVGGSDAPVLSGEAGIGNSALLDCVIEEETAFRVARAAGVESEMELARCGAAPTMRPDAE